MFFWWQNKYYLQNAKNPSPKTVTKTFQKAPPKLEASVNLESKSLSAKPKIRAERIARTPAFVTLNDHKENFRYNPTCRLINPSKHEFGKVSY